MFPCPRRPNRRKTIKNNVCWQICQPDLKRPCPYLSLNVCPLFAVLLPQAETESGGKGGLAAPQRGTACECGGNTVRCYVWYILHGHHVSYGFVVVTQQLRCYILHRYHISYIRFSSFEGVRVGRLCGVSIICPTALALQYLAGRACSVASLLIVVLCCKGESGFSKLQVATRGGVVFGRRGWGVLLLCFTFLVVLRASICRSFFRRIFWEICRF